VKRLMLLAESRLIEGPLNRRFLPNDGLPFY
jgi:hypothetical protein